ncbi:outer membrane protein transport protein [Neptuniibacter sp. CAU 1671]|uniref:OmpP1/FadL family transporter n=1 Tax=Neptuniibacter sp. CAU 1671 TaxID=3032593 RepID=UPI0023DC53E2|nr:outer membrane protein transport protein [Neptuniibacter sp. CAU 1671]MDF2182063.1 outer membrane protein transport protein [Neptuniibacter sp. CAU 1671]
MTLSARSSLTLVLTLIPLTAQATNGYFMHGSSVKAQGMAGVSFALAHDSIKSASNPASLIALGNQYDLGLTLFTPDRSSEIEGNGFGLNGRYDANSDHHFWIPEAGFARRLNDRVAYGLAMYANGGMNTSYKQNPFASFGATGPAGVDLTQLFVTGSLAYKVNEQHSVGVGVTYVYQRFAAEGIQNFAGISSDPGAVSNNGHDSSNGWGLKLGWQGKVTDTLTLGASWSSKVSTDEFNRYRGLFAKHGGFDVPESYGLGFAWQFAPRWTLAGDWERIEYSEVASVGNPLSLMAPLGADNGPGFGWEDIEVYKLGVIYQYDARLTLRAGYSHTNQPIPSSQTLLNILAPGVIEDHLSVGASWQLTPEQTLTFSYTHALEEEVKGQNSIPGPFGGGEANLKMSQDILGVAWEYRY